jgi:hypothetical protein
MRDFEERQFGKFGISVRISIRIGDHSSKQQSQTGT